MSGYDTGLAGEILALHKLQEHAFLDGNEELVAACGEQLDRLIPEEWRGFKPESFGMVLRAFGCQEPLGESVRTEEEAE